LARAVGVGKLAALVVGCGDQQGLPPPSSEEEALAALTAGLEAWKNGEEADVLTRRDPPIHFKDFAWRGGEQLENYEIGSTMERYGQALIASVKLTLKKPGAPAVQKNMRYQIDTSPTAIVIVPGDAPSGQ